MSVVVIRSLKVADEPAKLTKVFGDAREAEVVAARWQSEGYLVEVIDLGKRTSHTLDAAERDANFPERPAIPESAEGS